jgi:hypothetical protein
VLATLFSIFLLCFTFSLAFQRFHSLSTSAEAVKTWTSSSAVDETIDSKRGHVHQLWMKPSTSMYRLEHVTFSSADMYIWNWGHGKDGKTTITRNMKSVKYWPKTKNIQMYIRRHGNIKHEHLNSPTTSKTRMQAIRTTSFKNKNRYTYVKDSMYLLWSVFTYLPTYIHTKIHTYILHRCAFDGYEFCLPSILHYILYIDCNWGVLGLS